MIRYEEMKASEAEEQEELIEWAQWNRKRYPGIDKMYHVANGGSRNPAEAANLKRQGVKKGVPDLFLPVAKGGYHGLYIELKVKGGKPSEEQLDWIDTLGKQGYYAVICYGFEAAISVIKKYYAEKCHAGQIN